MAALFLDGATIANNVSGTEEGDISCGVVARVDAIRSLLDDVIDSACTTTLASTTFVQGSGSIEIGRSGRLDAPSPGAVDECGPLGPGLGFDIDFEPRDAIADCGADELGLRD